MSCFLRYLRNEMVTRCIILCIICSILGIPWVLEQPASSVMQYHPHFQYFTKRFDVYRATQLKLVKLGDQVLYDKGMPLQYLARCLGICLVWKLWRRQTLACKVVSSSDICLGDVVLLRWYVVN